MPDEPARDWWNEGVELFNAGRFFDCHEMWEEVWKRASGAEKLFYQGMIQIAAAVLHAQRGNPRGARSTWDKASAKLDPLPSEHMGIALGELRSATAAFVGAMRVGDAPAPPKIRRV